MDRRDFLKSTVMGAATLALPRSPAISQVTAKKPNILFIFTDDQRFDTIHALGNDRIVTPAMDSLVRRGTTFTNAYIMGGTCAAVCAPSRAMLMTGRTLFRVDRQGQWQYDIEPGHVTMPESFRNAGYETFGTGKWHNGPQSHARSFSNGGAIFFGGMSDHYHVPYYDFDSSGNYPTGEAHQEHLQRAVAGPAGTHSSELFSDAAIRFLKDRRGDRPFFIYISFTAPHDPREMPEEYRTMYDPATIPLPANYLPEHPFDNGELKIRDELLERFPRTPSAIRRHIADYYAMITHLDFHIGRVLKTLEETGHADDTIIVFAGDNGLAVGHHGLLGKQNLYEHSIHVPLILCGPGIPRGEKTGAFCYLLDIFPTLCGMTGVPVPGTVEGSSLQPAIGEPESSIRNTLAFAYIDYQRALRDKRFKLIEYAVGGRRTTQLFDLSVDPWETANLAGNTAHTEHLNRLRRELLRWREQLGDDSPFWETYTT